MKTVLDALKWAWRGASKPEDSLEETIRQDEGSVETTSEPDQTLYETVHQRLTGNDAEGSSSENPEPARLAEGPGDEVVPPKPGRIANLKKLVIRGLISACEWLLGPPVALVNGVIFAVLGVVNGVIAAVLWLLSHPVLVVLLIIFGLLIALVQGWL